MKYDKVIPLIEKIDEMYDNTVTFRDLDKLKSYLLLCLKEYKKQEQENMKWLSKNLARAFDKPKGIDRAGLVGAVLTKFWAKQFLANKRFFGDTK